MHKLARILTAVFAFAMCAALTVEARSITGVSRHFSQGQMLLDVTFEAGEPGDKHALYIAYDTEDKGADISNWAALQRGCVVADDATSATIPVSPLLTGAGYTLCRVFLTTSAAPYDTLIEWLRQTGSQYINTGIKPNGNSAVAVIDAKLDSNKAQQRFFGVSSSADDTAKFSFDCYINGSGYFASACKNGEGDWKSTEKFTTDRVRISLSAAEKHRIIITNLRTGTQIYDKNWSTTCSNTSIANLYIFVQNYVVNSTASLSSSNKAAGANLYSFTLTQGGSCVCDYKPCKLGNRAGVYDSVTDTIIYSASGTDFDAANSGSPIACSLLAGETQLAAAPSATDLFVPVYAKMVKGEGDVYAWRFYNDDWDDITDACGLSVPDPTIKVYVTSTEEVASILANPGTPAGYRIGNLSADADLTSLSPLVIETGSEIDLNGHALTVSGTVVDALKSSTRDLVVNGNFEAKSLSDGAYDTSAISGWSKSGTVALIKNNNSYAYKQSSSGSGDKQNTTVMCYIAKNGYITQTINVPEQVLCTLSLNKTNKNYYNGGKKYSTSDGSVQIDGSSKTTLASNAGNQGSISTKFELAAGSHTLKIACTSGTGFSVDNVKLTCTPSTATITSSAAGGELHVNVPSGSTVTNSAVSITGHVKFVKEGAGTFVSKRTELYYDGGNEIVEGKLTTAEGSGSNRDWSAAYRTLGASGKTMTVRKNGTLDIAGNYEYGNYLIVLDGGTLRSGKVIDTGPINQTTNTSWAGIGQLSLTTNSTFYLRSDTLFSGWDDTPINLNGHELLFQMPVDSKSVWTTKDMTNGTIRLTSANTGKRRFVIFKRNVDARTVDVIDEAGCISPLTTFSVRSYTSKASTGNDYWNGTARMYVYGTFTPVTDYFYGCTMMDGSTIDLSGRSGTLSLTSAANCGRRTVDFADNATIYIKLGDRRGFSRRTPVISWTTRPSNLDGLTFKRAEGNVNMIKKDDGVYIQPGLVVIVK